MASGRFGKANLSANADTDIYTGPTGMVSTVNVSFCNRNSTAVRVRLAVRQGPLATTDYLEYDAVIPAYGVLERTGIALHAGEVVTVRSDTAAVSVRAHGYEEAA